MTDVLITELKSVEEVLTSEEDGFKIGDNTVDVDGFAYQILSFYFNREQDSNFDLKETYHLKCADSDYTVDYIFQGRESDYISYGMFITDSFSSSNTFIRPVFIGLTDSLDVVKKKVKEVSDCGFVSAICVLGSCWSLKADVILFLQTFAGEVIHLNHDLRDVYDSITAKAPSRDEMLYIDSDLYAQYKIFDKTAGSKTVLGRVRNLYLNIIQNLDSGKYKGAYFPINVFSGGSTLKVSSYLFVLLMLQGYNVESTNIEKRVYSILQTWFDFVSWSKLPAAAWLDVIRRPAECGFYCTFNQFHYAELSDKQDNGVVLTLNMVELDKCLNEKNGVVTPLGKTADIKVRSKDVPISLFNEGEVYFSYEPLDLTTVHNFVKNSGDTVGERLDTLNVIYQNMDMVIKREFETTSTTMEASCVNVTNCVVVTLHSNKDGKQRECKLLTFISKVSGGYTYRITPPDTVDSVLQHKDITMIERMVSVSNPKILPMFLFEDYKAFCKTQKMEDSIKSSLRFYRGLCKQYFCYSLYGLISLNKLHIELTDFATDESLDRFDKILLYILQNQTCRNAKLMEALDIFTSDYLQRTKFYTAYGGPRTDVETIKFKIGDINYANKFFDR